MDESPGWGRGRAAQSHRQAAGPSVFTGLPPAALAQEHLSPLSPQATEEEVIPFSYHFVQSIVTSTSLFDHHKDLGADGGLELGRPCHSSHTLHSDPEILTCQGLHDYPTPAVGLKLRSHGL